MVLFQVPVGWYAGEIEVVEKAMSIRPFTPRRGNACWSRDSDDPVGWIAQLVEQRTENPCVAGSIPAPATSHLSAFVGQKPGNDQPSASYFLRRIG
jgi:hypothetical protein